MIRKRMATYEGSSLVAIDNSINAWLEDLKKKYSSVNLQSTDVQTVVKGERGSRTYHYKSIVVYLGKEIETLESLSKRLGECHELRLSNEEAYWNES